MSFIWVFLVFSSTGLSADDCRDQNCELIERELLDGGKLSALEVEVNDSQSIYVNPKVNLEGLVLPVSDVFSARSSRGDWQNYTDFCSLLSNGRYNSFGQATEARNPSADLLEGKAWAPEKVNPYGFKIAKAFELRGHSLEGSDGTKRPSFYVSEMDGSSEVMATILCEE